MKYDQLVVGAGLFGAVFAHEINKKGKITVKKKAKKGIHKLVVNVTAAGDAQFNKIVKKVTVRIKIKQSYYHV